MNNENEDIVIFRYTRAQAIEDGVLVDMTEWARETGFKVPVACTRSVWDGFIVPPEGMRESGQDERGRAHDLLWMLWNGIRKNLCDAELSFRVIFLGTSEHPERQVTAKFKSVCSPGDKGEPVVTIMLPHED